MVSNLFSCEEAALEVQMLSVCVRKIEFHRKRQVELGRERHRQVEKGGGR